MNAKPVSHAERIAKRHARATAAVPGLPPVAEPKPPSHPTPAPAAPAAVDGERKAVRRNPFADFMGCAP